VGAVRDTAGRCVRPTSVGGSSGSVREQEINQGNLGLAKQEVDGLVQQLDPDAAGAEGEIAGFPSLTYDAVTLTTPEEGESRFIMLFEGDEQYVINCQSTPDGRDEIEQACDLAVDTLTRRS
jgi:hypothetical protein